MGPQFDYPNRQHQVIIEAAEQGGLRNTTQTYHQPSKFEI